MFIVFEGLDGAGTSTQLSRMADRLRGEGYRVRTTREPSDGPIGVLVRQALRGRVREVAGAPLAPEALALLFAADRIDHLRDVVEPALAGGAVVLSDRYLHSSLAYQSVECSAAWVAEINSRARDPDLVVHVDVAIETSVGRIFGRGDALERFEGGDTLSAVARAYEEAYRARPCRLERVSGEGTIDAVHARIHAAIQRHLGPPG